MKTANEVKYVAQEALRVLIRKMAHHLKKKRPVKPCKKAQKPA
jgi:hypothetical protein